jgi:hypothetical protein
MYYFDIKLIEDIQLLPYQLNKNMTEDGVNKREHYVNMLGSKEMQQKQEEYMKMLGKTQLSWNFNADN